MSQMFLQFPFAPLIVAFALMMTIQTHAQDQSGFTSIDCGQQTEQYIEPITGITYITDTNLIDTGEQKVVSMSDSRSQFRSVRIFRKGTRNCYKINSIIKGQKYLIRATFVLGDYDREEVLPRFELHLGASFWDSLVISDQTTEVIKELIHVPWRNYLHVCLINIGEGFPFISTIELRPLHKNTYPTENVSLALHARNNLATNTTNYRYPEDVNDRIWGVTPPPNDWKELSTSSNLDQTDYQLPSRIMSTAVTPPYWMMYYAFDWKLQMLHANVTYHAYLHLAEIDSKHQNLSRQLLISFNGKQSSWQTLEYLKPLTCPGTLAVEGGQFNFTIDSPSASGYEPFLNAYEVYFEKKFLVPETDEQDVEAITKLKSTYGIIKNWQGDPCYPQKYRWIGVNCSYSDHDSVRIIFLNLSSSGLAGDIADSIANLTMLQTLDLSNNELKQIPESLSQLHKLQILNLEKNELTGSIPAWLIAKKNNGLSLRVCENPSLSGQLSCEPKKNTYQKFVIPIVVFTVVVSCVVFAAAILRKSKMFHVCESLGYGKLCKVTSTESEIEQKRRGHDVFLSFRGKDTRTGFARYLHAALDKSGIKTFFDDQNLQKGDEIGPKLLAAIEVSEISVILFSENYVNSSWCLSELVKILDCKRKKDQRIVPVFYKVNPTDIRHQSGCFSLQKWIDKGDANVTVWKEALAEVANLAGYPYNDGYEIEMIEKIVNDILAVLKKSLCQFDTICPPEGEDKIVIYMTSSARDKNFQNCRAMLQSLSQLNLKVQERDVTVQKFEIEFKNLLKENLSPPRLFVNGKYVGGYDEVSRLINKEPWFCEVLNKLQRRCEMNLQQDEAGSVDRISENESDGRGGSLV